MTELDRLTDQRDTAVDRQDLAAALTLDDQLEDLGMHADDRATCFTCQSWADHAHERLTGARMTLAEFQAKYASTV